jgi:hypothetical protein
MRQKYKTAEEIQQNPGPPELAPIRKAFVAMKFNGDSWNDKRYQIIKEVAEEGGYAVKRGDEITSSGAVVEEVCGLMRDADLVIIDTTGDSHSVAYELGYCHGIGRTPADVVLLREGNGNDIPFNYRHYRSRCYKDLRHLRQVLRQWFSLSAPIPDSNVGYCFAFRIDTDIPCYGAEVATAVLAAIRHVKFSGRSEFYAGDFFLEPSVYLVGVGFKSSERRKNSEGISPIIDEMKSVLPKYLSGISIEPRCSEYGALSGIKASLLPSGVIEFLDGIPMRIVDPTSSSSDSWFAAAAFDRVKHDTDPGF